MKLGLVAGMETIAVQHDLFGDSLTMVFQELREYIDANNGITPNGIQALDFGKRIESMTFNRTGIKIKLIFNAGVLAACMPYYMNKNHIFIPDMWRGEFSIRDQEAKLRNLNNRTGEIDIKKAKVSGMFSEHTHQLWLDVVTLVKYLNFTPREITAIFLHELGHLFTTLEMSNRLEETNQVLANLNSELREGSKTKLTVHYKELQRLSNGQLTDAEVKDLESTESNVVLGAKLFRLYVRVVKSQLPVSKYNETSSEQMADDFATRFGYGKELVTALDSLYEYSPEKMESVATMASFINIIYSFVFPILMLSTITMMPWVGVFGAFILGVTALTSGDANADMTYDNLERRYRRIRNTMVTVLADSEKNGMAKDEIRAIVDKIKTVDMVLANTRPYKLPTDRLANILFSWNKRVKNDVELQQQLEDLAHNNLIVRSAELNTMI